MLAVGSTVLLSGCANFGVMPKYDMTSQKHVNSESFTPTNKVHVDAGALVSTVTYTSKQTGTWVKFNNDCKISHIFMGGTMAYQYYSAGKILPSAGKVTIKGRTYDMVYTDMSAMETTDGNSYWLTEHKNFLVNANGSIASVYPSGNIVGVSTAVSNCSVSLLKDYTHVTTDGVSVYYMGRTNSGFLKIGIKKPKDFQDKSRESVNIPAQPGVYSLADALPGYSMSVFGTSRFRAELQLEKGVGVN